MATKAKAAWEWHWPPTHN